MPIKRERVKKFYDMVAKNRQVKKLLGDNKSFDHIRELLTGLDNYLVSPSDQRKGVQPDEATRDLRSNITKMRTMLEALESNRSELSDNDGFSAEDEATFRTGMEAVFSGNPSPEQALENYIHDHGDKQLASKEIQLAASLISAFRGMNDILEHEKTVGTVKDSQQNFNAIKFGKTRLLGMKDGAKDEAIENELDLDNLEQRQQNLNEESDNLAEEEKQLIGELKQVQNAEKMKLPAASLYKTAETELETLKNTLKKKEQEAEKAIAPALEAEAYEAGGNMAKGLKGYEKANAEYTAARDKANAMYEEYKKHELERRARDRELEKKENEMLENADFSAKYDELKAMRVKRTDLARGAELLRKALSDEKICKQLRYFTDGQTEEELRDVVKGESWEYIERNGGTELETYLLAKYDILDALSDNPEAQNTASIKFRLMEATGFSGENFEKSRDEILNEIYPEAEKALDDKCAEFRKDEEIDAFEKLGEERKRLEELDDAEYEEGSKVTTEEKALRRKLNIITRTHDNMVKNLCSKMGIYENKEVSEYRKPENWKKLRIKLDERMDQKAAERDAQKDKVKKAEQIVENQKSAMEKAFNERENPSEEEKQLGNELTKLANKKAAHEVKAEKLSDAIALNNRISNEISTFYETEDSFMHNMDTVLRGNSYAQKISAQLEKLKIALAAPKRKSNSGEYTRLAEALDNARTIFSGKAENWNNLMTESQQLLENRTLDELKAAAEHYLSEKEKEPHIWPFASTTGFKRRAAANDILSFCESAKEMVANAEPLEREYANLIAAHKNQDGTWKENLPDAVKEHMMAEMKAQVKTGIELNRQEKQAQHEAPEKKVGGKALGE